MEIIPIPQEMFEKLCEENPEMASQVVSQLHKSANASRQKRLDEAAKDES
jgi:CRP-like cAMP-binding protein